MSFLNLSFEQAGDESGCASGWVFACHGHWTYADFGGFGDETFDWSVLGTIDGALPAAFEGGRVAEDFAFGWGIVALLIELSPAIDMLFDGASTGVEAFALGWISGGVFNTDIDDTSPVAALFDATPEAVEDFAEGWYNQDAYVDDIADTSPVAAIFDSDGTPEAVEDFEEGWTLTLD